MAITFTWSVKDLHKVDSTGAVYKVERSCSGVDADTEGHTCIWVKLLLMK